jgi:hypothetical protein
MRADIDRDELVEATRDQWQAQGILAQEPQSEAWLRMLVPCGRMSAGSQLAFVSTISRGSSGIARQRRKKFYSTGPRQSEAFSTRFLAIWLDPRTQYPELRQQLIGGQK